MNHSESLLLFIPPAGFRQTVLLAVCGLFLLGAFSTQAVTEAASKTPDLTEMPLEALMEIEVQTVYAASKFEQKATAAPASVTVITSDEIKRYGYQTLADILQSAQGLYTSYDRNYSFLGMRGISLGDFNSRILLLVDGHRINSDLTDGALIETGFILDVDLIDRVEIIRGPGSALYGNNALLGVINVITRQGHQVDGAEVSGQYASYNTYDGRVSYGKQFTNGVRLLLSGTVDSSSGHDHLFYPEFNTPAQNNGVADHIDAGSFQSFFGSVGYRDFTLQGAYINRAKQNPTAQYFTTFNDPHLWTTDERSYVNLKYAHSFPDVVDVTAQVYYDRSDFNIAYPVAPTQFKEKQSGEWWGTELQLNKRLWERHIFTLGAEYRDDFQQHRLLFDQNTRQVFTDTGRSSQSYAAYFQGDIAVRTNLHVNGGVRYDQSGDYDPKFNPRLAAIWNPWEKSAWKAIYGTAFRAPNFLELSDPRFQDIQPEEITTGELVYEQEIGRSLRSSVAGFYSRLNDLIALQNGSFTNFNADTRGVEVALDGNWASGLRGRLSYSFQLAQDRANDARLPDSPEHLAKLNVTVPLYKDKIFAGLEFLYTGSRHTVFTSNTGATQPGSDAKGFGVVNLTLFSQNLVKNLSLSASIYNLLDTSYGDPASRFHQQDIIPQDGRTFRVKLTYRF